MDLIVWVYLLCALTGIMSLGLLTKRVLSVIHLLTVEERRQVLNRILLAVGLGGFGLSGLLLVWVIRFESRASLLFSLFFTLLFVRSSFAILKNRVHQKLAEYEAREE